MKRRSNIRRPARQMERVRLLRDVQIEKPVYGGAFLARDNGKAVFVPLLLPGESARVRITHDKGGYAQAEVEEILVASPERKLSLCAHFGACGGCDYQHTSYPMQLGMKAGILQETFARAGLPLTERIDTISAEPWGYRNRVRFAVSPSGELGYRGRRSHEVVAIHECPIAAPLLVRCAMAAGEILRRLERKQRPEEIAFFCNADERAVLATVFIAEDRGFPLADFSEDLRKAVPQLIGTATCNETSRTTVTWGDEALMYHAGGNLLRVGHGAFFQANRYLIDTLVQRVVAEKRGNLAWDLFAGVGLFARALAERFEQTVAVEAAHAALTGLRENVAGQQVECVEADCESFVLGGGSGSEPELIVMDPPRAGLGKELARALAGAQAEEIVYVSCDPATLARDLRVLTDGGYRMEAVTLVDLFPQTFHLETVVNLRRS